MSTSRVRPNPKLGISPEGTLLEFSADLSTDFGFAYERFLNFRKESHSHERFVFCTARGSCVFAVTELKTGKKLINSSKTSVFKAPNSLHTLRCDQTVYENLVFLPTVKRMRAVFEEAKYSEDAWIKLNKGLREIERSPWFDAVVDRYFKKRIFAPDDHQSLVFLETEILREVLVLVLGEPKIKTKDRSADISSELPTPLVRAIQTIEISLFSKLRLESVAKASGMSRSALMRTFQAELQMTPMAYVRQRKLEEARRLIDKQTHSVTETSYLVGYEDVSAFCRAYKEHFGFSPSQIR